MLQAMGQPYIPKNAKQQKPQEPLYMFYRTLLRTPNPCKLYSEVAVLHISGGSSGDRLPSGSTVKKTEKDNLFGIRVSGSRALSRRPCSELTRRLEIRTYNFRCLELVGPATLTLHDQEMQTAEISESLSPNWMQKTKRNTRPAPNLVCTVHSWCP